MQYIGQTDLTNYLLFSLGYWKLGALWRDRCRTNRVHSQGSYPEPQVQVQGTRRQQGGRIRAIGN